MASKPFMKSVEIEIPDGEYSGLWGAYTLTFEYQGDQVSVETERGVRGMDIPVTFTVSNGRVDEKSIGRPGY